MMRKRFAGVPTLENCSQFAHDWRAKREPTRPPVPPFEAGTGCRVTYPALEIFWKRACAKVFDMGLRFLKLRHLRGREARMRIDELREIYENEQREYLESQHRAGELSLDRFLRVREWVPEFCGLDREWLRRLKIGV